MDNSEIQYYGHSCLCGCGGKIGIRKRHSWAGIPKYIHGHNKNALQHGETGTKLYLTWINMRRRCLDIKNKSYKDYGGRGITICPEWTNDYIAFRDWAINNGYTEGLQINRINNDGNYEPNNCRFLTIEESNRNTRKTITMEIANEIRYLWKTGNCTQKELSI